jgi:hypothetical protein
MELIHYVTMLLIFSGIFNAVLVHNLRIARGEVTTKYLEKSAPEYVQHFVEKQIHSMIPRIGTMYQVDDKGNIREKEVRGFCVSKDGIDVEIYDYMAQSYHDREEKRRITHFNKCFDTIEHEESGYYDSEQVFRGSLRFYNDYKLGYHGHLFDNEKAAKEYAITLKHEKMEKELKKYQEELEILKK